jgi:hypothetical protein
VDTRNLIALTRPEKEELILDLYYNKGKTYHEIAKEARISLRDIKGILNKGAQGADGEQSMSKESQAYKLFYEGKSPIEVAIALNLREPHVADLYKECWNLKQLYDLNQIYLETKGYLAPLMNLYKLIKAEGYRIEHATRLLKVANNDLPRLENEYERLKEGVNSLEEQYRHSDRKLVELHNEITESSNSVEHYRGSCRQEERKLESLRQKRMKLEALITHFENNNEEYVKIRKSVEDKVHAALSDRKGLLKLALLSLTQSMRNDPEKYSSLIHYGALSTGGYSRPYYGASYIHAQQPYQTKNYGSEDYMAMLVEEADKLCNKLPREVVDKIITNYSNHNSFPLPLFPPSQE